MVNNSQLRHRKRNRKKYFFYTLLFLSFFQHATAQNLIVQTNKPGAPIQPTMWGIFFEDINLAADGGLYAELVKNRSFEFTNPLMGWTEHPSVPGNGTVLVLNRSAEKPDNPRFIRVTHYADGPYTLSNEGFRGMGIKAGETYHFSVWDHATAPITLRLQLQSPDGRSIGAATLPLNPTGTWKKDTVSFTATTTDLHAHLSIGFEGQGAVDLDMISLFPDHTWKQRPGGLRADLVQLLADMHPGFIRFPGGCIVEGRDLANRYQWKKTVGKVEDRQLIINRWNTEFAHRPTPDYFQSFGLGFFEYFQLAEDIGAQPLPILNCGMACQFNTSEVVPIPDIDPYIQDALDLIEFANGDATTKWGGLRAAMGHPEPFHLKMMGVGNEQWGPQYVQRYRVFSKAIKAKYPGILLVNSTGPDPNGEKFDFLNDTLRKLHADILDEHYYRKPDWFLQNANRYDRYDRNGPAIFAGEYAAQSDKVVSVNNRNNWECALAEAAFMTGLERNADVVRMASYAPLFAHVDGWQWAPDLIWFDNLRSYGTPDYYVQKLFATNKGTAILPLTLNGSPLTGQEGLYGSATIDSATHEVIIKLVNAAAKPQTPTIRLEDLRRTTTPATVWTLTAASPDAVNSLDNPMAVSPNHTTLPIHGKNLTPTLAPYTFSVIRIKN
jgi:alpha-L-arabinofuranosidase